MEKEEKQLKELQERLDEGRTREQEAAMRAQGAQGAAAQGSQGLTVRAFCVRARRARCAAPHTPHACMWRSMRTTNVNATPLRAKPCAGVLLGGRGGTRPRRRRVLPRRLREPSHAHLPGRTPSLAGERVAQGAYKCDHHAVQGPRRQHSARRLFTRPEICLARDRS